MIILNRKRLIAMLSMICVAVFVFNFQIAKKEETVSTVALPVSNKVVVIDAGHGVPDERSCLLTLKITLIFYKK